MIKIVIGFLIISMSLNAYVINGQDRDGDTIIFHLKCSDGSLPTISKNTTINRFFPGNTSSMDKAANNVCKKRTGSKRRKTFKKGCAVFNNMIGSHGIESALISNSDYNIASATLSMGSKYGFLLGKKSSFDIVTYSPRYLVTVDKYGNYLGSKAKRKHSKMTIDGYYKIKDRNNKKVYIRKNCSY